jgi:hypothetical protein
MQADNRFCRNCSHHRDGHIKHAHPHLIFGQLVSRACYGRPSNESIGAPGICYCEEYIPKDNLEYLEWCVDKRRSYETAKR